MTKTDDMEKVTLSQGDESAHVTSQMYVKSLDLLTSSGVQHILRSPAHFKAWVETPEKETKSLAFGKWLHLAAFRQAEFMVEFNRNKPKISWQDLVGCAVALSAHPFSKVLFAEGVREQEIHWEERGVKMRATPDLLLPNGLVVDLKSTRDASDRAFERSVLTYGYDVQGAMYERAVRSLGRRYAGHVIVAVESAPPYGVNVFKLGPRKRAEAHEKIETAISILKTCIENNKWPSYGHEPKEL